MTHLTDPTRRHRAEALGSHHARVRLATALGFVWQTTLGFVWQTTLGFVRLARVRLDFSTFGFVRANRQKRQVRPQARRARVRLVRRARVRLACLYEAAREMAGIYPGDLDPDPRRPTSCTRARPTST